MKRSIQYRSVAASGSFLRWRTEAMLRHFGAVAAEHDEHEESEEPSDNAEHDEHEGEGEHEEELSGAGTNRNRSFTDAGFYTALTYGFEGGKVQAHLRGDYVSGVAEAGMSERWRVSPAVSWQPSERLPISFVVQYNYDRSPSFGEEHSVWAQFRFNWGESGAHEH